MDRKGDPGLRPRGGAAELGSGEFSQLFELLRSKRLIAGSSRGLDQEGEVILAARLNEGA